MKPPLRAFLNTTYALPGVAVRIGRRCAAMDALLAGRGARHAAFITAWNPRSRRMPRGWNERMQHRLRQAARGRVLAEGFGGAGDWSEHHLLVRGDPRRLRVLGRRFRQWAIVAVAAGRPARLVACLAQPDRRAG
jgi:hypothetical protein